MMAELQLNVIFSLWRIVEVWGHQRVSLWTWSNVFATGGKELTSTDTPECSCCCCCCPGCGFKIPSSPTYLLRYILCSCNDHTKCKMFLIVKSLFTKIWINNTSSILCYFHLWTYSHVIWVGYMSTFHTQSLLDNSSENSHEWGLFFVLTNIFTALLGINQRKYVKCPFCIHSICWGSLSTTATTGRQPALHRNDCENFRTDALTSKNPSVSVSFFCETVTI